MTHHIINIELDRFGNYRLFQSELNKNIKSETSEKYTNYFLKGGTPELITHFNGTLLSDQKIHSFTSISTLSEVLKTIIDALTPNNKAFIFEGWSKDVMTTINAQYVGVNANNLSVYLVRGNANCPDVINMKLFASGVGIIVKWNNEYYTILHKDHTKAIIYPLGGTCERNEREIPNENIRFRTIARREVFEETKGTVLISGSQVLSPGLVVDDLTDLAILKFSSTYFGVSDIDDTYHRFGAYFDLTNIKLNGFWELLFHESNRNTQGFALKYIDHNETQHILAIPLTIPNSIEFNDVNSILTTLAEVNQNRPTLKIYSEEKSPVVISSLSLLIDHIYLAQILDHKVTIHESLRNLETKSMSKDFKFPPSLRYLRFLFPNSKI